MTTCRTCTNGFRWARPVNNLPRDFIAIAAERDELRLEVERLQKALAFWLPHRPTHELPADLSERLEHDIYLLVGYMGKMETNAEERGWIRLSHSITGRQS